MRIELARLHDELAATMIYVTHDQIEAMTMADKIVVLQGGVVEQAGSPLELYHHPHNLFVAGFIGSPKMNFMPATVTTSTSGGTTVQLASGASLTVTVKPGRQKAGDEVTLGVRPEHMRPAGDGRDYRRGDGGRAAWRRDLPLHAARGRRDAHHPGRRRDPDRRARAHRRQARSRNMPPLRRRRPRASSAPSAIRSPNLRRLPDAAR